MSNRTNADPIFHDRAALNFNITSDGGFGPVETRILILGGFRASQLLNRMWRRYSGKGIPHLESFSYHTGNSKREREVETKLDWGVSV